MIKDRLRKIPSFFKRFYFIAGLMFFAWLLIFDSNDLITQIKLSRKQKDLEKTKAYYEEKIAEVKKEREAFLNSRALLEKMAREKYLMKKKGEDVFVVVNED